MNFYSAIVKDPERLQTNPDSLKQSIQSNMIKAYKSSINTDILSLPGSLKQKVESYSGFIGRKQKKKRKKIKKKKSSKKLNGLYSNISLHNRPGTDPNIIK